MKTSNRKTLLNIAVGLVMGLSITNPASADPITSFELQDWQGNGRTSDFSFIFDLVACGFPPGNSSNAFGSAGETGCTASTDGNNCDPIDFTVGENPPFSFSTGFDFGGTGIFTPSIQTNSSNGQARGEITIDAAGALHLNFTQLDFAGFFNGSTFFLSPESAGQAKDTSGGIVCQADQPFSEDSQVPVRTRQFVDNGDGTYNVIINFSSVIDSTVGDVVPVATAFDGFLSRWRIEGIAAVADSKPTIFPTGAIDGSITLAPGDMYTEPGVVCQDVIDGALPVATTYDPLSTDPNNVTSNFDVVYDCQDSQVLDADTVRRMITVSSGPDVTPPDITLNACMTRPGIDCSEDGSANTNAVKLLTDTIYVDAGGSCFDNVDLDIPLTGAGAVPNFTSSPFPAAVDFGTAGMNTITFTCKDSANNTDTVDRTVEVIDDDIPPVISLGSQQQNVTLTLDSPPPDLAFGITCTDTNPIDPGAEDITNAGGDVGLDFNPTSVDTSVAGTTNVVYSCADATGNMADTITRTFDVVTGQTFEIISMTVSDIDNDRIAGCFKFDTFDPVSCVNAHRFSSDDSVDSGFTEDANKTLPGVGSDKDGDGKPIGIRFGVFQDGGGALEGGEITQGFNFSGFPFVPITFNPNDINATSPFYDVPKGFVTVTGPSSAVLTFDSLPWGGVYTTSTKNVFDLSFDPGTISTEILGDNNDDDGITRTFNYIASWTHIILRSETSSLDSFNGFLANFRVEGVITVGSEPVILNTRPVINDLTVAQGGLVNTTIVTKADGLVTAAVDATDPDGDDLVYDWSESDVPAVGSSVDQMFVFDPAKITSNGDITLRVIVSDEVDEPLSARREAIVKVTSNPPTLGPGDTDGDGISDEDEGFGDTDNDLIPDYQDPINLGPMMNRRDFADPGAGNVVSDAGRVRLGKTAYLNGDAKFIVKESDLGEPDRLNRVDGIGHSGGGLYDFEIDQLDIGGTVRVVLPQAVPLPAGPKYRKYTEQKGWFFFSETGGNALASTMKVAGLCPGPDDVGYDDNQLKKGDDCVRLTIIDGGTADGDGIRNGVVVDPGVVFRDGPVRKTDGSGGGGGCTTIPVNQGLAKRADWLLLALIVAGLGCRSRLNRRSD